MLQDGEGQHEQEEETRRPRHGVKGREGATEAAARRFARAEPRVHLEPQQLELTSLVLVVIDAADDGRVVNARHAVALDQNIARADAVLVKCAIGLDSAHHDAELSFAVDQRDAGTCTLLCLVIEIDRDQLRVR